MINISLQPEYILSIYGLQVTNTLFTSLLVTVILAVVSILIRFDVFGETNRLTTIFQIVISEILKLTDTVTGDRKLSKKILPLVATFFILIVTANLLAIVPGFLGSVFITSAQGTFSLLRSPNSDLTTTLSLALISVISIQWFSIQTLGIGGYLKRFFDFTNPVRFFLGFFEGLSEAVKVLSFSFRLFGNIFAGEILLLVMAFLMPYVIPVPFMILEVFVGVIQAFIFSMLTLTFIKSSTLQYLKS